MKDEECKENQGMGSVNEKSLQSNICRTDSGSNTITWPFVGSWNIYIQK